MVEPKSRKEKACQNGQCLERKSSLYLLRELWFCFSGAHFQRCKMRSPQIPIQSTWASRQMIRGLLSQSSQEHPPPLSTHGSPRHLPACRQGPEKSLQRGCCLCSYNSNAIWFSSLMASASHGMDRRPHTFRLGSISSSKARWEGFPGFRKIQKQGWRDSTWKHWEAKPWREQ